MTNKEHEEIEHYGDPRISSGDAPIPRWLKWTYLILPIWGVIWWIMFWNGSDTLFNRGYWEELQQAANTTFPQINVDNPKENE